MMRSMFSGVSSLRVHQTRMDVIANNIANVNTDGFKAQRATFADAFYQNLQGASGPDPTFGRPGTNPRQIGLGVNLASIDNLMHQGVARRTDNALDVAIEGGGFFIVRDRGGANMFTRAGRIEEDFHGNLHIGGNSLMGWSTRPCGETPGGHAVDRGLLVPLSLSGEKRQMPSEPTTRINITGNLNTTTLSRGTDAADNTILYRIIPKTIFDSLGNAYRVNMRFIHHPEISGASASPHGYWTMEFMSDEYVLRAVTGGEPPAGSVRHSGNQWWIPVENAYPAPTATETVRTLVHAEMGGNPALIAICMFQGVNHTGGSAADFAEGMVSRVTVAFNSAGDMVGIGRATPDGQPIPFLASERNTTGSWNTGIADQWRQGREFTFTVAPVAGVAPSATFGETDGRVSYYAPGDDPPEDTVIMRTGSITFNFEEVGQRDAAMSIRALTWDGGGPGTLQDISVGPDGTIMGRFSNGRDRLLGQIPLAFFTNPAGLERVGNSFWRTTANSGPFDGVGLVGQMIGGALEGSNVDLANEFTEMIVTQRGFQAASRTITVSDEMLQELVNLRR